MVRRVTIVTLGKVVERGDLVRDFDDIEIVPAATLIDEAQPVTDGETVFHVGAGEPESLAHELARALQLVAGDAVKILVEEPRLPGGGTVTSASVGALSALDEQGSAEGASAESAEASTIDVPVNRPRPGVASRRSRHRGTMLVRFGAAIAVLAVLGVAWRVQQLGEDWALTLGAVFVLTIGVATLLAGVLTLREVRRLRRALATHRRKIDALRRRVKTLSRVARRSRTEQARAAAAASMTALTLDEYVRHAENHRGPLD